MILSRIIGRSSGVSEFSKEMKKFNKQDQRLLAIWAADCAERVLPYFEEKYSRDNRPRKAIETGRKWTRSKMMKGAGSPPVMLKSRTYHGIEFKDIRSASLAAHAAARKAKADGNNMACFAARSAGQAVATAHVPQHAFGAAYYALKLVEVANPENTNVKITKELRWQESRLPLQLRPAWKKWQKQRLPKSLRPVDKSSKKV